MSGDFTLTLRIAADGRDAANGLRVVSTEVDHLSQSARGNAVPAVSAMSDGFGSLAGAAVRLGGVLGAGMGLADLASGFVTANMEAQRLQAGLTAVTGDSVLAAAQMDYVKDAANRMGLSVNDVADAYIALMAASKGTTLEGQATRDAFEAVSLAMSKLGKSSADTQGALLGLEQLISSGTANLEDLRQVTDRIPGGMKAAADGMGLSVEVMKEMISKGEILSADIVPGLTDQLNQLYDDGPDVSGLRAEWNLLKNAFSDAAVALDQVTGATSLLGSALAGATTLARGLASALAAAANAKAGLGLTNFTSEAEKLEAMEQRRLRAVQDYADAVAQVEAHSKSAFAPLTEWAAGVGSKLKTLQQVSQEQYNFAEGLKKTAEAATDASTMMDGPVQAFRSAQEASAKANAELLKLNGSFDKSAEKQAKVAEYTAKLQEINKTLGNSEEWVNKQVEAYSKSLDEKTKRQGSATGASKALTEQLKAEKQAAEEAARAHDQSVRAVEGLIDRYLPAEAAAIDYEEAMKALADAGDDVKLSQDQAGLSADQLRVIQQGLQADLQKTQIEAVKAAGGFAGAWVEAAEQLDDSFKGLWRNLISGEGDVLGDLKRNVLEWLADLSYQLLLKPLVVPIQGLMMGMAGINNVAGGATGLMGAASNVGGLSSTFSGLSSLASGISSVFSGAAFTGIMNGFGAASGIIGASGYFGGFGATMGLASGAASAGSTSFAIGAAAPYLLPAVIAIGAIAAALGAFDDKKPRYGTLAAQTLGRSEGLEDNEWGDKSYSKGGFGLMFGITDKGSKNIKAPEMKETFDALADVSKALEDFFGPKLSAEIKNYLDDLSNFGDGLLHLTEDEGDLGGAIARLVQLIGQAAGRTTDDIGKAFFRLSGDLGGSVEEVQKQLQTVIAATVMAVQVSENWRGEVGQLLGLTGAFDSDLAKLLSYSKLIQTEDEITAEALLRLIAQMQGLADAAFTTGQALDGLDPKKLVQIADDLATQFGGVENLTKAVGFYMANFMTAGELALRQVDGLMTAIEGGFSKLRTDLSEDFANLGEVMPTDWLDQIPQTRAAFVDLVQSLDLTTEAGRVAYKGLMDLAPAFDALFDAVESFQKWIDPAGELERATERVRAVFQSLGLEMPNTYEALQQLYRSGALSAEQMAVLAAILGDLDIVFKQTGDGANVLTADMWGLSGAFAQAMEAITAAIADTRSQISDFGLTDAELYDRYLAEARRLQESLSSLDSAEQVEEVTRQINDLIRSAWGVLDDAARSAAKDQFIGYLDDLEQAAADRLKALQDATNAEDEPLMQAAAGFGEAALNFGDAVDGFDASVAALADVVGALDQIQSQQAAYTAAVQNQPAFSTVAAPDTSVYQSMAAALTAAAADLRSAAAEYQKAGATMDGAAKGMTTAGAKIASAAADIPSAIAITVTATGATATVEASF